MEADNSLAVETKHFDRKVEVIVATVGPTPAWLLKQGICEPILVVVLSCVLVRDILLIRCHLNVSAITAPNDDIGLQAIAFVDDVQDAAVDETVLIAEFDQPVAISRSGFILQINVVLLS